MKNKYYVYLYIDTSYSESFIINNIKYSGRPIYIGKGTNNRAYSHLKLCKKAKYKKPFYDKLNSMLKENNVPKIIIIENNLSEDDAFMKEEHYIRQFKIFTDNGPLYNYNYGGKGGHSPSQIIKDKISNSRKGKCKGKNNHNYGWKCKGKDNLFYGKHHTEESKRKMHRSYYLLNIDNLEIMYIKDISLWCKQNKHSLSKIIEISHRPMRYKNYVVLKDNNYTKEYVDKYFNFIKQNIRYLRSSSLIPVVTLPDDLKTINKDN